MVGDPGSATLKIRIEGALPYVSATLTYGGKTRTFNHVVLDTGSAGSVFAADEVAELGILPETSDLLHRVRGVGGFEFVYSKKVDALALDTTMQVSDFVIQVGALHYGFPLQGIVGLDFLLATRAVLDFGDLKVSRA